MQRPSPRHARAGDRTERATSRTHVLERTSPLRRLGRLVDAIVVSALRIAIAFPWLVFAYFLRFLYRFRLVGKEKMPQKGPLIVLFPEIGVISNVSSTWAYWTVLRRPMLDMPEKVVSYAQEQLWALPYMRTIMQRVANSRPIVSHAAGPLALHLLDGFRALRDGGIVTMNPEGDMPWDGRPLPLGSGAAWLALRTAAPIVPLVWEASIYDIWPRWRLRPWLTGRPTLIVGDALRLCDAPMTNATQQDVEAANARIRVELDRLTYGAGGVAAWMGPPTQGGKPLRETPRVNVGQAKRSPIAPDGKKRSIWRQGVAQLLWRCPVCGTLDAIRHEKPTDVSCAACDTRWTLQRVRGRDYRLRVIAGPPSLVDLEMALTAWYDQARDGFAPQPVPHRGRSPRCGRARVPVGRWRHPGARPTESAHRALGRARASRRRAPRAARVRALGYHRPGTLAPHRAPSPLARRARRLGF